MSLPNGPYVLLAIDAEVKSCLINTGHDQHLPRGVEAKLLIIYNQNSILPRGSFILTLEDPVRISGGREDRSRPLYLRL